MAKKDHFIPMKGHFEITCCFVTSMHNQLNVLCSVFDVKLLLFVKGTTECLELRSREILVPPNKKDKVFDCLEVRYAIEGFKRHIKNRYGRAIWKVLENESTSFMCKTI